MLIKYPIHSTHLFKSIGGHSIDHVERYVPEPKENEELCNDGIIWSYSKKESQRKGSVLMKKIMSSPKTLRRWGEQEISNQYIHYDDELNDYFLKGNDIELIVISEQNGAKPEHVIKRFDVQICMNTYYFGFGFIIPSPSNSFHGRTNINQNRGGLVVEYMTALQSNFTLSFDDAVSKFNVDFTARTMKYIKRSFQSSNGGFFHKFFDPFHNSILSLFENRDDYINNEQVVMCSEVHEMRRLIITDSLRTACTKTDGNDPKAMDSPFYDPIQTHNSMYSRQICRYMKYGMRDITFPELPSDFVSSVCYRDIYRELPSPMNVYNSESNDSSDDDMSNCLSDSNVSDDSDGYDLDVQPTYQIDNWISLSR